MSGRYSYTTNVVTLPGKLSSRRDMRFLRATVFETPRLPFAIVHFEQAGVESKLGLRLDLDKQVFLDHFEDQDQESLARAAAPQIVAYLGRPAEAAFHATA